MVYEDDDIENLNIRLVRIYVNGQIEFEGKMTFKEAMARLSSYVKNNIDDIRGHSYSLYVNKDIMHIMRSDKF